MDLNAYFLIIFIFTVLAVTIYLSYSGNRLAKQFLWFWALLLAAATPFIPQLHTYIANNILWIIIFFILYGLFFVTGRNERKLVAAYDEVRRLLTESNRRMDEERRRIAHQLHDELNPKLVLTKLELQKIAPIINDSVRDSDQAKMALNILEKAAGLVTSAYQESRSIIKNTRVELIEAMGLAAAIEALIEHYRGIVEIPSIVLSHNLQKRSNLPGSTVLTIYRIIQEALFNAIKHAEARQITISICCDINSNKYDVAIVDDGIGIRKKSENGIGMIDMRERARVLGAELHVEEMQPSGTRVSFSFVNQES